MGLKIWLALAAIGIIMTCFLMIGDIYQRNEAIAKLRQEWPVLEHVRSQSIKIRKSRWN